MKNTKTFQTVIYKDSDGNPTGKVRHITHGKHFVKSFNTPTCPPAYKKVPTINL